MFLLLPFAWQAFQLPLLLFSLGSFQLLLFGVLFGHPFFVCFFLSFLVSASDWPFLRPLKKVRAASASSSVASSAGEESLEDSKKSICQLERFVPPIPSQFFLLPRHSCMLDKQEFENFLPTFRTGSRPFFFSIIPLPSISSQAFLASRILFLSHSNFFHKAVFSFLQSLFQNSSSDKWPGKV